MITDESKSKPLENLGHGKPRTRRELLAQGIIGFSALSLAPSAFSLFGSRARAEGAVAMSELVPLLVFDMAGGAGLPGNFLVGKTAGPEDLLRSYDTLGWDPRGGGAVDKSFGAPMAARESQLFKGIKEVASAEAQANLRMGTLCHFSQDDTSANQTSILSLAAKAGSRGTFVPNGLGMRNTGSGGNSDSVLRDLTLKPLAVAAVDDLIESVSYGPAFRQLPVRAIEDMARTSMAMSATQAESFQRLPLGRQLKELSGSAYAKNVEYAQTAAGIDPRADEMFRQIYGIQANTAATNEAAISATIVMNVLKKQTGPGVLTLGGCDYHDGTQSSGDQKDLEMGRQIGRAVEAAHRLKSPLFFEIVTDGGVYARAGTRNWQGDSGDRSLTVVGLYDPNGAREQRRTQVGSYTDGQGAARNTVIGPTALKAGYAAFANYLSACGKAGEFETVAPGIFTASELDSVLVF